MAGSIFGLDEFKPLENQWLARSHELARRASYYDGSIYSKQRDRLMGMGRRVPDRFYRGIKPLYLPLARAVDVDTGIVPGAWAWPSEEDLPDGVSLAQLMAWKAGRKLLFDMSHWQRRGVLYVHNGAVFGVSGLRVANVRTRQEIQLCPCSPQNFMLVEADEYDSTPVMAIWIEHRTVAGAIVEYAEVIEPGRVRTFLDGMPKGVAGRLPEYPNELGFVPFVEVAHMETGAVLGESTFQKTIPLLDEVNELASYLADVIRKHTDPQWIATGVEPVELHRGDNTWFLPAGASADTVTPDLDIDGVLAFLQEIRRNVEGSLPELAFDELKAKDQIATATLELQLMELVLKIKRVRPNYDQGLIDAMRMAGMAAREMGLPEIALLDDDDLTLNEDRPVLPVSRLDEIAVEEAELALKVQEQLSGGEGLTQVSAGALSAMTRA